MAAEGRIILKLDMAPMMRINFSAKSEIMIKSKLSYRPEIDGLRAIAVISVILYHAKFVYAGDYLFKGGYIGVDIFFVISGYLIARIILQEINDTEKFSFLNFYERRSRNFTSSVIGNCCFHSIILATTYSY